MTALGVALVALFCLLVFMLGDVPRCGRCGTVWGVAHRHRGTAYVDEVENWVDACPACYADERAYWEERWAEYYAGCL